MVFVSGIATVPMEWLLKAKQFRDSHILWSHARWHFLDVNATQSLCFRRDAFAKLLQRFYCR